MVPSLAEITSTFQPCKAAKRSYIRNRSPANSEASSPPVPARISSITLRSSMASLGNSARRICCASSRLRAASVSRSASAMPRISGSVEGSDISASISAISLLAAR
jgi:hypothetical protein